MIKRLIFSALLILLLARTADAGVIIPSVATGSASGSISPSGSVYATAPKTYTFTAATGYTLNYVTNNNATVPSSQISGSGPWYYTVPLSAATQTVRVYFKLGAPTTPPYLLAIAPTSITATVNTPATISGTNSTIAYLQPGTKAKFKWTSTSAAVFNPISSSVTNPAYIVTQFTAAAAGNYTATLTLTAPGATPSSANVAITVPLPGVSASNACLSCHNGWTEANSYTSSPHAAVVQGPACQSCHNPTGTDSHPFTATVTIESCNGCHLDNSGAVPLHPIAIGSNLCVACHDPHSTAVANLTSLTTVHYNNVTTGMYPASYVTSRAHCADCHYDDSSTTNLNATRRHEWARSGHAANTDLPWTEYDFKAKSGCVQCHTTTGFIVYSTGKVTAAWGVAADKTKEVLACNGCHKDIATGAIRTVTPVRPFADDTYVNRNVGESNICIDCHSGTNNGQSITAKLDAIPATDFTNLPFIDPHYLAAGATLHGKAGYHFSGQSYAFYSTNTHHSIGIGNPNGTGTAGPCIACHKNTINGHTFVAGFQNGTIPVCTNCHGNSLTATTLAAYQADFANALDVLRAQLTAKGFVYYSSVTPRFSATNWGYGQAGADTMGAAFNYALLRSEPGGYAHNSAYAKQLIFDSIDYLYNGRITGDITTALTVLVNADSITKAQADSVIAYKKATVCTDCHGGPANTSAPMATNAYPAHITGAYGPASYLGNDQSACQVCHPYPTGHANGTVDALNGSGSACAGCHPGTIPAWNGGVRLACTSCHAAIPSVLPNNMAAPYKANFTTSGHGQYAASNQCTACHNADSAHIDGLSGTTTRLLPGLTGSLNAECTYCHNNPAIIADPGFSNMSTHFTTKGGSQSMACATCHDPHGTTNLSMIRTVINGQPITFTDRVVGLINTTTNQGLCQVCHSVTNHYRAGVPETAHPTENCLGCHPHNAAGGAFKPNGTCDACHGYPPAPRLVTSSVTFGIQGSWSSARFEDYSGGGGAHLVAQHVSPNANPSEGWANCTICHNGGRTASAHYHRMILPLSRHIDNVHIELDQAYRFSNGFAVYTGAKLVNPPARNATGSCFNVSCHFTTSPKWSIER